MLVASVSRSLALSSALRLSASFCCSMKPASVCATVDDAGTVDVPVDDGVMVDALSHVTASLAYVLLVRHFLYVWRFALLSYGLNMRGGPAASPSA